MPAEFTDLIDLGFDGSMFVLRDGVTFEQFVNAILTEKAAAVSAAVGSAAYSSTVSPVAEQVKRAEVCLVAAELMQRRINMLTRSTRQIDTEDIDALRRAKNDYVAEANDMINKVFTASIRPPSMSGGVVIS